MFFSIKKKVKGGNTTGGSKTLPSSNSSPVHSVQPPPHSGEVILDYFTTYIYQLATDINKHNIIF